MGVRTALARLFAGEQPDFVECRQCGTTLSPDTDACTACGATDFCRYDLP